MPKESKDAREQDLPLDLPATPSNRIQTETHEYILEGDPRLINDTSFQMRVLKTIQSYPDTKEVEGVKVTSRKK